MGPENHIHTCLPVLAMALPSNPYLVLLGELKGSLERGEMSPATYGQMKTKVSSDMLSAKMVQQPQAAALPPLLQHTVDRQGVFAADLAAAATRGDIKDALRWIERSKRRESPAECLARLAKKRLGSEDLGELRSNEALLSHAIALEAASFSGSLKTDWLLLNEALAKLRERLRKVRKARSSVGPFPAASANNSHALRCP
jgi:hypothetical protein